MISVWTVEEQDLSWAIMHIRVHRAAELSTGGYRIAIIYIPVNIAGYHLAFALPRLA